MGAIAFSSRRLPMKHHGQTTSDTTSIGSSVAPALAGAGIGFSSMFEEKIGRLSCSSDSIGVFGTMSRLCRVYVASLSQQPLFGCGQLRTVVRAREQCP